MKSFKEFISEEVMGIRGKYMDLISKTLNKDEAKISKFMAYIKDLYGDEWWSEWEGASNSDIIRNIKEVLKSI